MSERKKRKFDDEKRVFNSKWELMYLCIEHNNKPMCLIYLQVISVLKEYNISRHYTSMHKSYDKYTGDIPTDTKYKTGDTVYYKAHHLSSAHKNFHAGFAPKWWGPVKLHKRVGKGVFITDQQPARKIYVS